jgi:hypothetical protein
MLHGLNEQINILEIRTACRRFPLTLAQAASATR